MASSARKNRLAAEIIGGGGGIVADATLARWASTEPATFESTRIIHGGGGGIRTHGPLAGSPVFKTGALGRYATPPCDTLDSVPQQPEKVKRKHVVAQSPGYDA